MIALTTVGDTRYRIDLASPIDISIPMLFSGSQPNVFGVDYASALPVSTETFTGDVSRGGSCNVAELRIIPHCNATHTECIGHITRNRIGLPDVFAPGLLAATVVTVQPNDATASIDEAHPPLGDNHRVIDLAGIREVLDGLDDSFLDALVVRTLPNDDTKKDRHYTDNSAPFFTPAAMGYIVDVGVQHLVVDLPSVDRLIDEGRMAAHRRFWGLESDVAESADLSSPAARRTITELVYLPETVKDGIYLLDLQVPTMETDAVPSRPVLFPATRAES